MLRCGKVKPSLSCNSITMERMHTNVIQNRHAQACTQENDLMDIAHKKYEFNRPQKLNWHELPFTPI